MASVDASGDGVRRRAELYGVFRGAGALADIDVRGGDDPSADHAPDERDRAKRGCLASGHHAVRPDLCRSIAERSGASAGHGAGTPLYFYLVLVTWAGDTGAFYVGSTMGKRLLCPSISPRKTVEGSVGGLVCSIVASGLAKLWFWEGLGAVEVVVMGLGLGAMGQVGDLCESMLKRSFGVKDTGALIPGHGGLLDRVDSLLFTAPVLYVAALAGWV